MTESGNAVTKNEAIRRQAEKNAASAPAMSPAIRAAVAKWLASAPPSELTPDVRARLRALLAEPEQSR